MMRPGALAGVAGAALLICTAVAGAARAAEPVQRIENRSVAVYGLKLHFLEAGRGPHVIFLHGFGGNAEGWRETMQPLAGRCHLLALDEVGFGASDKPAIDYSLETLVDFLDGFMNDLGIAKASLVGHSMGARVACLFALRHPEKVERLVLMSGAGYKPDMNPEILNALNFHTLAGARRMLQLLYYDDAAHVTDHAVEEAYARRLRSGSSFAMSRIQESYKRGEGSADDLSPIKAPTLILWGREDEVSPFSMAEKAQRQINGSRLVTIERCGHLPMVEAASRVNNELREFLSAR